VTLGDKEAVCEVCECVVTNYMPDLQMDGGLFRDNEQDFVNNIKSCPKWDYEESVRHKPEWELRIDGAKYPITNSGGNP
jgi:hypothetical protein